MSQAVAEVVNPRPKTAPICGAWRKDFIPSSAPFKAPLFFACQMSGNVAEINVLTVGAWSPAPTQIVFYPVP